MTTNFPNKLIRETPVIFLLLVLVSCFLFYIALQLNNTATVSIYFAIILFLFFFKQVFSTLNPVFKEKIPEGAVVWAVVPVYNEDKGILISCIQSILDQTYPAERIYIIDDGSENNCCDENFIRFLSKYKTIKFIKLVRNKGKRFAEYEAFQHVDDQFVATVDSDTVLNESAFEEALRPMSDSNIACVCGNVEGLNANQNLLTRLINLRLKNAFLLERASLSFFGTIMCSSGMFSLHRGQHIKDNLDDYISQKYLGQTVSVGNDRRLSFYALQKGKIVLQKTAKAKTVLKSSLIDFIRQQIRWNRSAGSELPIWIFEFPVNSRVFWTVSLDYIKYLSPFLLILTLVYLPSRIDVFILGITSGYFIIHGWLRYIKLIYSDPSDLIVAPFLGIIHLVIIMPIKLYALLSMHKTGWLTR